MHDWCCHAKLNLQKEMKKKETKKVLLGFILVLGENQINGLAFKSIYWWSLESCLSFKCIINDTRTSCRYDICINSMASLIAISTYCNINAIMTSARRPVNISWFVKDMVQLPGD